MKGVQCNEIFGGIAHKNQAILGGIHFSTELTEAMWIKCLTRGHNIVVQLSFRTIDFSFLKTSFPHDQYAPEFLALLLLIVVIIKRCLISHLLYSC